MKESWILTTGVNAGGKGQRYAYPYSAATTREDIENARRQDELLEVPNEYEDGEPFFINPDQVVSVYPKVTD